jgi:hypothetical protein
MNKPNLSYCNLLLDSGFSLLTVGNRKTPNYTWTKMQTKALSKSEFEKKYNYDGGYKYTDDKGVEHEIEPTVGVGIITGYQDLEGVDVDLKVFSTLKARQDFWNEYLSFLKDNISDFDDKFVIVQTKNDGYHIIYKCETIAGNQVLAGRPPTDEELAINPKAKRRAIIETRGKYGYLFIYEKFITNLRYQDVKYITPFEREMLFECSKFYDIKEKPAEKITKKTKIEYAESEITPWEDYNNKTDIFDIISDEFTVPTRGNKTKFTTILRNGSDAAHSGYIYKNSGCMYLFSTATTYPAEELITPFRAYAIKYHNGNFTQAAKELYNQGYGSRKTKQIIVKEELPEIKNVDFPIEIFPKFIRKYLIECNKTLNSSIDYMGSSLLWLFSIMIGNHTKIRIKNGWEEKAVIWITIVGKAGLGKTPSIKNVTFPIEKINSREIKKYIKEYEKYEAFSNLSSEEKKNSEQVRKPRKTQFIANDITMEALVGLHEENKNAVGVFKDELAGWIKDMNKYRAGSDVETWLSAWSGAMINLNRKTAKSSFLENPFISVLGGIQPSILTQFFTQENKDNGFIDRLLLCYPDLEIEDYNDNEMDYNLILNYSETIVSFYDIINKSLQYGEDNEILSHVAIFDNKAKIEWKRIFSEITELQNSKMENEYMKSMLPKQKSYLARFSLIIHLINWFYKEYEGENKMNVINKKSILKAEKLMYYFIDNAKKIKVDSVSMNVLRKIYRNNEMKPIKDIFRLMYEADSNLNKTDAADVLGVSRQQIYRYISEIESQAK